MEQIQTECLAELFHILANKARKQAILSNMN
jgi:hypothetical protein